MNKEDLKIGMFVRTKKGIARITKLESDGNIAYTDKKDIYFGIDRPAGKINFVLSDDGFVLKVSSNIIDILEVGDYVNGEKITNIIPQNICANEVLDYQHIFVNNKEIFEEDIKSIVTHEQMEQISYKLGE